MTNLRRRHIVLGVVGATGALVVGWSIVPPRQRLHPSEAMPVLNGTFPLNGWVKVGTDNRITVMMSQVEMGQGAHTGLAMILADEMDADWQTIQLEQAGLDSIYNNQAALLGTLPLEPDAHSWMKRATRRLVAKVLRELPAMTSTGGSSSIKDQWLPLREAGASARAMLIEAAAAKWGISPSTCSTSDGSVKHPRGPRMSYGELAAAAATRPVPPRIELKHRSEFKLVGQPIRRLDNAAKLDGSAAYAIDALPEGLLYASVVLCPTVGGSVTSFDGQKALAMPGVHKVVSLPPISGGLGSSGATAGGIAVIATTPFQAMRALDAVEVNWNHGPAAVLSSAEMFQSLLTALDGDTAAVHLERGDVDSALMNSSIKLTAVYRVPLLAHATMEPMNCTVQFKNGAATVWAPCQAAGLARAAAAKVLGIDASKVDIKVPFLGGGFGRRFFFDYVVQAATLARETGGAPVQLLWSREQDISHDFYRPAFMARCEAGLDARGALVAWKTTSAGSSMGAPRFLDTSTDGASNLAYTFPAARVAHQNVETLMSLGIWRSVSHSQNAFFVECFMDEVAAAAHQDPMAFRIALLKGRERHQRVLRRLAELVSWDAPLSPASDGIPRARGVALVHCFGSVVGQVAEVSAYENQIRVHRVTCVIDCGLAVNPNLIRQQVEGAIVFGLSAALHGEITVDKGRVQQSNFHDYAPIRMSECPEIVTDIVGQGDMPMGIGEAATPPIAPAVANALFALTGQRLRTLPLKLI